MKKVISFIIFFLYIITFYKISSAKSIQAKILYMNVEHKFIVLNKGKKDDLFTGLKYEIYKGAELLGITEIIKAKTEVAAFNTKSFKKSIPLAPGNIVTLKITEKFEEKTAIKSTKPTYKKSAKESEAINYYRKGERLYNEGKYEEAIANFKQALKIEPTYKQAKKYIADAENIIEKKMSHREKDYSKIYVNGKEKEEEALPEHESEKEETPLLLKPFSKIKQWFKEEEGWKEEKTQLSSLEGTDIHGVSYVDFTSIKLETQMEASRRKVLFLINEELKNRGFIITNYSLIEGTINAQKPLQLSAFKEIFANMSSAIDYRIMYTVDVKKIDMELTHVDLDISTSYKKKGKYRKMEISREDEVVQEAKDVLVTVKNRLR